ncbi:MAG TPA: putative quinol monooxygenase [Terriglobales bacterium]|nr:putative quinol monooxygenase [Terriglobales bacterium]
MSDTPIVLNVFMEAVAGREQDLANQLRALLEPTRKEPGCLVYELHSDPENQGKFLFYEKFRNQAALDFHIATPHFKKFLAYREAGSDPVAMAVVTRWQVVS